MRDEEQTE